MHPTINSGGIEAHVSSVAIASGDAMLEASQRVDWRFLLPDPYLGRVAFSGKTHGRLLESLKLFSAVLTVVKPDERMHPAVHDLVVTNDPTFKRLSCMVECLRPDGWLYLESRRSTPRGLLRFPRDYTNMLKRLGMEEIEAHWHWPNFESCTEIIPLNKQAALLQVLTRHQGSKGARLKSMISLWLQRAGVLSWVVPCVSVLARKKNAAR